MRGRRQDSGLGRDSILDQLQRLVRQVERDPFGLRLLGVLLLGCRLLGCCFPGRLLGRSRLAHGAIGGCIGCRRGQKRTQDRFQNTKYHSRFLSLTPSILEGAETDSTENPLVF